MSQQVATTEQQGPAAESPDGLILAQVKGRTAWDAVQALRAEMQRLSRLGDPHATFVSAIAADGRSVPATDPDAEVLALGYELRPDPVHA